MVYIFTEDSGSGFDFISTIIKRVIKPKQLYCMYSLQGCSNVRNFELLSDNSLRLTLGERLFNFTSDDVVILFLDICTNLNDLIITVFNKCNTFVFLSQGYYCFESVFYEYTFKNQVKGNLKYHDLFVRFKSFLLNQDFSKFSDLLQEYNIPVRGTPEQFATLLLSKYYSCIPCVLVNKNNYGLSLDASLIEKRQYKAYYNNLCNTNSLSKYCEAKCRSGYCSIRKKSRGTSANLRDFYYNTSLSSAFICCKPCAKEYDLMTVLTEPIHSVMIEV